MGVAISIILRMILSSSITKPLNSAMKKNELYLEMEIQIKRSNFEKCIPRSFEALIVYENKCFIIIGAINLVSSTIFVRWSRFILGKIWSSYAVIKKSINYALTGPLSITRHPIYTGIIKMLFRPTLMNGFGNLLVLSTCVFIFLKKINNVVNDDKGGHQSAPFFVIKM